jgi:2-oxo-4-hydroxy-4-carboxy-5-ureidoimidazoline decarboxylase
MTIDQVNVLDLGQFVDLLGGIYEHSPWVAERVWQKRPFRSPEELRGLMRLEVDGAGRERQLSLLRAHPDLGTRVKIGEFSSKEQKGAGLDQLTHDEYKALLLLNQQYRDRFGFPFVYAVQGSDKHDILKALMVRLESSPEAEFAQALREVHRIAAFRYQDLIREDLVKHGLGGPQ